MLKKFFKYTFYFIVFVGVALGVLFGVFGMRVESDGTGIPKFVRFDKPEAHYAALDANRAAQKQSAPPLQPVAAAVPAAVPHASAKDNFARDGIFDAAPILTAWPSAGLKQLWKQPVGGGYASFVIAQGRAFTIEQRRAQEVVAAYDVATGRELWTRAWAGNFRESMGGDGPRATPTWHEGKLYALGAEGELECLDAETGKVIWSKNILTDNGAANITWGMSASPLIVDDKVIVLPGGAGKKSVVAYNKLTGERVWGSLDDNATYASPSVETLAGQRQILLFTANRFVSVAVEDGKLLWEFPWRTEYDINSAQPIVTDANHVFISSGYDHGCALLEITRVEIAAGSNVRLVSFTARKVWENKNLKNKFTSSVLYQGYIYGLDENILACIDAKTGERKWKGGRYGYGQILLAGGKIIVLSETGRLALVNATPEAHQELASFQALDGKTWNYPAIAGGRIFVRNTTEMAAFQIAP
ncbi:MAG: PQQ-like beta-propeller repeat protein [Acidobacteria bacterium]|nr:PQQ-like beta-propeller repeat protein [Acidobacteriota bacterium]